MTVTKAIIPVAGWGTRRLPVTKSIEKCMLPIGNRPAIDFIVQDCLAAGITDIYFVVSGAAHQLRTFYAHQPELEAYLEEKNKAELLASILPPKDVNFHFVTQDLGDGRYGTTTPVWLCREFISEGEQFLVIMGDNVFYRQDGGSNAADLITLAEKAGVRSALFGTPVPIEEVEKYGVIEKDESDNYIRIFEHPKPDEAPSNLNNASFYLFDAPIFEFVEQNMNAPRTGEYMIIDAINSYAATGSHVKVGIARGDYFDMGDVKSWLKANAVMGNQGG